MREWWQKWRRVRWSSRRDCLCCSGERDPADREYPLLKERRNTGKLNIARTDHKWPLWQSWTELGGGLSSGSKGCRLASQDTLFASKKAKDKAVLLRLLHCEPGISAAFLQAIISQRVVGE